MRFYGSMFMLRRATPPQPAPGNLRVTIDAAFAGLGEVHATAFCNLWVVLGKGYSTGYFQPVKSELSAFSCRSLSTGPTYFGRSPHGRLAPRPILEGCHAVGLHHGLFWRVTARYGFKPIARDPCFTTADLGWLPRGMAFASAGRTTAYSDGARPTTTSTSAMRFSVRW